ncbi:MAG: hypothetical protein K8E66_04390, partial [Phycisphaerales bacterium]|nr:hypothetical protein [Phycisphaerales bacterium]
MTQDQQNSKRHRAPHWTDWLLPAAASVVAIVLLTACFGWWSFQSSRDESRAAGRERLESIGIAAVTFASDDSVSREKVDGFLATIGPKEGLVTAERLEPGADPRHLNPDLVSAVIPLPRELGVVHLVDVIEPKPLLSKMLLPGAVAGGFVAVVGLACLASTRRTSGLRRIGSALRAVNTGETDR